MSTNPYTLAKSDPSRWHETTPEQRERFRNILPPHDVAGGFAVPEAIRHGADGRAVYLTFATVGGRVFCRELPVREMEAAIRELRASPPPAAEERAA